MPGYIHHVQWSVLSVQKTTAKLRTEYGMRITAVRNHSQYGNIEVVLTSGNVTFLISPSSSKLVEHIDNQYPLLASGRKGIDTVFNICMAVDDVDKAFKNMTDNGSSSICDPEDISNMQFAAVTSPCENVIHSLVNINDYDGVFLPGFTEYEDSPPLETSDLMTHIDHVTYVCNIGDTERILSWYRKSCGMERFLIAPDEDPEVGVVFEDVGMKLNVGNWITEWMCREEGVKMPLEDDVRNFKLVLAEPLPGDGDSHVDNFLRDHDGPGIQHIGLSTDDIRSTVSILNGNGAEFRKPPSTYYKLEDKKQEILSVGGDPAEFGKLGILIDKECAEHENMPGNKMFSLFLEETNDVFLLQIFSFPLFGTDTFFLEVIQRENSRGFGGGNIRALAQSIVEFQREKDQLIASLMSQPTKQLAKTASSNEFSSLYNFSQSSKIFQKSQTCLDFSRMNLA